MRTPTRLIPRGKYLPPLPQRQEEIDPLRVWLVGIMACGKSSVSRILSQELDATRVDMDDMIVRDQKQTISQIFATVQEEGFREIEKQLVLRLAAQKESMVISTG